MLGEEKIIPRIASFSQDPASKLMYSHYADEHRGICIEYTMDFEKIKKNKKINYGEANYKNDINRLNNLSDLYMLKNEEWKYEKEFRMVRFDPNLFMDAMI